MDLDPGGDVLGPAERAQDVAVGDARRVQLDVERLEVLRQDDVRRRPAAARRGSRPPASRRPPTLRAGSPVGPQRNVPDGTRGRTRPASRGCLEHRGVFGGRQSVDDEPVERPPTGYPAPAATAPPTPRSGLDSTSRRPDHRPRSTTRDLRPCTARTAGRAGPRRADDAGHGPQVIGPGPRARIQEQDVAIAGEDNHRDGQRRRVARPATVDFATGRERRRACRRSGQRPRHRLRRPRRGAPAVLLHGATSLGRETSPPRSRSFAGVPALRARRARPRSTRWDAAAASLRLARRRPRRLRRRARARNVPPGRLLDGRDDRPPVRGPHRSGCGR